MPGGSFRAVRRLPDRLVRPAGRGRWRSPTAARRASPPPRARHQGEVIDEPKRADHEGTFVAGEAVAASVAVDEVVESQFGADGLDRRPHPQVVGGGEAHEGQQQRRGVEIPCPLGPDEGARGLVDAVAVDSPADRPRELSPAVQSGGEDARPGETEGPIDPPPRKDFRYALSALVAD